MTHIYSFLRSHPWYTTAVVLTLGLSMGTCLAILQIYSNGFLREPGYQNLDELYWLRSNLVSQRMNPDLARSIRKNSNLFDEFAAYSTGFEVALEKSPQNYTWVSCSLVEGNLFDLLGVQPEAGRGLHNDDLIEGSEEVMLITHDFWLNEFGGSTEIIDTLLNVNGHPARLVGVLPPDFEGPSSTEAFDIFIPVVHYEKVTVGRFYWNINWHSMSGIARILDPIDKDQITDKVDAYFVNYVNKTPNKFELHPRLYNWEEDILHQQKDLTLLYGIFSGVLLSLFFISFFNCLTFIILKTTWRKNDILVRRALGASRRDLFILFSLEALTIVGITCLIGISSAAAVLLGIEKFLPTLIPNGGTPDINAVSLVATIGIGFFLTFLLSIVPLFWHRKMNLGDAVRGERGSSRNLKSLPLLAGIQVGIATVLIVFTSLFILATHKVANIDLGYDADGVCTFSYNFSHLNVEPEDQAPFRRELEDGIRGLPEVEQVATGSMNFLRFKGTTNLIYEGDQVGIEGQEQKLVSRYYVGMNFLDVMDISLKRGRDLSYSDSLGTEYVVLVNQALADRYYANEEVIGKRFRLSTGRDPLLKVVGVVSDFYLTPSTERFPSVFIAQNQFEYPGGAISVKTDGSTAMARLAVQKYLDKHYSKLGEVTVLTGPELLSRNNTELRSGTLLVSASGILALLLSLAGLFIVFSFSSVLKQRDYAIRLALGASPRQIVVLAFKRFSLICVIGLALGFISSYFLTPLISDSLMTLSPRDPLSYGLALSFVLISSYSIALFVSLRTLSINPARELHE